MNIAQDIVDEILSRLPVKSLTRFKGVCKSWYVNIHSDSFIKKHLNNQTSNEKILMYEYNQQNAINNVVSICSEEKDDDSQILFHQSEGQQYFIRDYQIIGTCDGLVCLDYMDMLRMNQNNVPDRVITLWNPATEDFKTLPPFQQRLLPQSAQMSSDHVSFGFDIDKKDYKVIRILHFLEEGLEKYIIQMKIYSLNTNSWKEFDCSGLSTKIITPGYKYGTIFCKKKFCWLARDAEADEELILSFDMGKERFQKTPLPSDYVDLVVLYRVTRLFHLHDSIALVHYVRDTEKTFAIWTTKELEQERSSWIRMFNIGPLSGIDWPLGFWKCKNSNNYLFLFFYEYAKAQGKAPPDWIKYKNAMKGIYMNNQGQIKNERLMTIKVKNSIALPMQVFTNIETLVPVNIDHNKSSLRFA